MNARWAVHWAECVGSNPERIAKLDDQNPFANLATSKKPKDSSAAARESEEGGKLQTAIRATLATLESNGRYMDRNTFEADVTRAAKRLAASPMPRDTRLSAHCARGARAERAEGPPSAGCRASPEGYAQRTEK